MEKLIATFHVELPGRFLFTVPEDTDIHYQISIEDADVEIIFPKEKFRQYLKKQREDFVRSYAEEMTVVVRKDEVEPPPEAPINEHGGRDWTTQSDYFLSRLNSYKEIAIEATNRVVRFFKYRLHQPNFHEFMISAQTFQNPEWTDENGSHAGKGVAILTAIKIEIGFEAPFTVDDKKNLQEALKILLSRISMRRFYLMLKQHFIKAICVERYLKWQLHVKSW